MATVIGTPLRQGFTIAAPGFAPLASFSGTGGLLGNGNYQYKITFVTGYGETTQSLAR